MPKISEFFGITIYMFFREHAPPHFHAKYGGEEVLVSIEGLSVVSGRLSPRALGLVIEWATYHQAELRQVWGQAVAKQPLGSIEPLK
ncbi:MAG: DUF4160 domain-containing protein [Deltaproteobacteria bacterium]|nr:DUF4160 domain-containing protein [Deltaproteobacteria bacterium]